jgi:hypothetical protein
MVKGIISPLACVTLTLFCVLCLLVSTVYADSSYITSLEDFYAYYGDDFTRPQQEIISSLFAKFKPYLTVGAEANQLLIADGYVPASPQFKNLGALWCKPSVFVHEPASTTSPNCVFADSTGRVVNVVWLEDQYNSAELENLIKAGNLNADTYTEHKNKNLLPQPTILADFEQKGSVWHYHDNLVISNLGDLNPQEVNLKQALFNENWVKSLQEGFNDKNTIISNYEISAYNSNYPPYNQVNSEGVYMSQMWIGLGNPQGLMEKMHPEVSLEAINILETFERKN